MASIDKYVNEQVPSILKHIIARLKIRPTNRLIKRCQNITSMMIFLASITTD